MKTLQGCKFHYDFPGINWISSLQGPKPLVRGTKHKWIHIHKSPLNLESWCQLTTAWGKYTLGGSLKISIFCPNMGVQIFTMGEYDPSTSFEPLYFGQIWKFSKTLSLLPSSLIAHTSVKSASTFPSIIWIIHYRETLKARKYPGSWLNNWTFHEVFRWLLPSKGN